MTGPETDIVRVGLDARAYDIRIGPTALGEAGAAIRPFAPAGRVFVVTDRTVWARHGAALGASLGQAGLETLLIPLEPGEAAKSLDRLGEVLDRLLAHRLERRDLIVAFGGGVVGDLAGFAAAIALRGIDFVQIPTTLLAQVDSSVGGKTGINTAAGKNLVGAFHQPRLVLADTGVLDTLPRRDLLAGYAEIVKYGALGDAAFFEWLEANGADVLDGPGPARTRAIVASCRHKAAIVAEDEREAGKRALLNLGHTFGHALEGAAGYDGRLLHGEAVAIGMVLAFEVSERLALCPPGAAARLARHLGAVGLPTSPAEVPGQAWNVDDLIARMGSDKKVSAGKPVFILARGIGQAFTARDVDLSIVRDVIGSAIAA